MSSALSEPLCPSRPGPTGGPGFYPARAEVNSARGKVLPPAKRLHGAGAAPSAMGKPAATTAAACRRPRPSRCAPAGPGRLGPRISSRAGRSEFRPRQGFASGKTLARRRRRPICDGEASGYDSSSLSSSSSEPLCPSRPRPAGGPGFHPARAEVNSARGKVLPPAKRLHGAGAAPSAMGKPAATTAAACRRPRPSRWLC